MPLLLETESIDAEVVIFYREINYIVTLDILWTT